MLVCFNVSITVTFEAIFPGVLQAKNKGETEAVKDSGTGVKTDPEKS